jgi:hypothetical protein
MSGACEDKVFWHRGIVFLVTALAFRLKAEVYKTSRKARIKAFTTFSVSTTLKAIGLQASVYLPE